jgi:HlyD family secretion protein
LLEVEVEVLSSDAVKIAPGTEVRFERWGGEGALEGVVRVVEPVGFTKISALGVEEQRVNVIADFVSPPPQWQRLGDQYRVDAVFVVWRGDDVLHVPTSSLFRQGDGWATFVVEDGHASLREVEVGQRSGLRAEIRSGLSAGETVIVHPDSSLEDGSSVEVIG